MTHETFSDYAQILPERPKGPTLKELIEAMRRRPGATEPDPVPQPVTKIRPWTQTADGKMVPLMSAREFRAWREARESKASDHGPRTPRQKPSKETPRSPLSPRYERGESPELTEIRAIKRLVDELEEALDAESMTGPEHFGRLAKNGKR